MDEIVRTLAQHLNISEATARNGLGAVITFLKGHLPAGLANQLETSVPGAGGLAEGFEANKEPESSGGVLGMVTGIAGKLIGGQVGAASQLASLLGQAGLSMDQVARFVPKAAELLKDRVPKEVYDQIIALVPTADPAAGKA